MLVDLPLGRTFDLRGTAGRPGHVALSAGQLLPRRLVAEQGGLPFSEGAFELHTSGVRDVVACAAQRRRVALASIQQSRVAGAVCAVAHRSVDTTAQRGV